MQNAAPLGAAPELQSGDLDNHPNSISDARSQQTYRITVRSSSDRDAIRALRALLKMMWRRFGLRCIAIERLSEEGGA
jgi:hypothetical protein